MQQEQRNWYPLSYISMFQKQITELLNHSTQQYALFLRARRNPSAIDNIILDRALDLFGEQQPETLQLYQGQVDRWFEEDANNIYTAPLTQLNADLEIARKLTDDIVELLEELETIEDLLEKDDLEVAIDFLSGILQLPHKQRMNNDAVPSVGRYIPRNTFTITADKIAFYNEAIPLLESFKTLFLQSLGKDPDLSQKVYKRLNLPEDFALDMFLTNRTGIIEDYSIYALKYNGSNAVQRAFNKYRHNFNATALNLFEAATQAHFGFLEICSPIGNQGAVIYDHILEGVPTVLIRDKKYVIVQNKEIITGYYNGKNTKNCQ